MPTIIDLIPVGKKHDGRRKISDEQKQHVLRLYNIEQVSINKIAKIVGISKRSVQFILFPERRQAVIDRAKEVKRWEKYNTAEIRKTAMRKNRAKKKQLLETGQVKITPEILTKYEAKLKEQAIKKRQK